MAPTTAWEVDTGSRNRVMPVTVAAAATEVRTAISRSMGERPCRVSIPCPPSRTAPRMTNRDARRAAFQKRIMWEETAEPNRFAASLAPNDHPRKTPPSR